MMMMMTSTKSSLQVEEQCMNGHRTSERERCRARKAFQTISDKNVI